MTVSAKDLILLPWDRHLALVHVGNPAGHPMLPLPWGADVPAVLTAHGALVAAPEKGRHVTMARLVDGTLTEGPTYALPEDWRIRCLAAAGPVVYAGGDGDGPLLLVMDTRSPENQWFRVPPDVALALAKSHRRTAGRRNAALRGRQRRHPEVHGRSRHQRSGQAVTAGLCRLAVAWHVRAHRRGRPGRAVARLRVVDDGQRLRRWIMRGGDGHLDWEAHAERWTCHDVDVTSSGRARALDALLGAFPDLGHRDHDDTLVARWDAEDDEDTDEENGEGAPDDSPPEPLA